MHQHHEKRTDGRKPVKPHGAIKPNPARNDFESTGCGKLHQEHRERRDPGRAGDDRKHRRRPQSAPNAGKEDRSGRQNQVQGGEQRTGKGPGTTAVRFCHDLAAVKRRHLHSYIE